MSPRVKEFLKKSLVFDCKKRASVNELLETELMQGAKLGTITSEGPFETRLSSAGYNLYQFQWAHCFNEIVCKHMENEEKLSKIRNFQVLNVSSGEAHSARSLSVVGFM